MAAMLRNRKKKKSNKRIYKEVKTNKTRNKIISKDTFMIVESISLHENIT